MKITLHIGQYKTGSTSIQEYLLNARESLLKNNILYPKSIITRGAHFKLSDGLKKAARRNIKFDKSELFKEIDRHQPQALVLSTEALCADVMSNFNPNLILKSWEILNRIFPEFKIKVCYYYREQASAIESRLNQIIKTQRYVKNMSAKDFMQNSLDLDYLKFDKQVNNHFSNSIPLAFVRDNFYENDLIKDFSKQINIPYFSEHKPQKDKNISPSNQTISFLKEIQVSNIPEEIKDKLVQKTWQLNQNSNLPKARILRLNELKSIRQFYKASNKEFLKKINANEIVKNEFKKTTENNYSSNIPVKGARFLELMYKSFHK